jgi:transglutaminase-like putative cysteine protease
VEFVVAQMMRAANTGSARQAAVMFFALLTTVAGYDALFAGSGYRLPLVAAVVFGLSVAMMVRVWRLHHLLRVLAPVLVVLAIWWLVRPDHAGSAHSWVGELVWALTNGIPRILSLNRPLEVTSEVLALPFLVTFAATYLSVLALGVAKRPLLPLLPASIALAAPLVFSAGGGPDIATLALGFVLPGLGVVWMRSRALQKQGGRVGGRAQAMQIGVIVTAVAVTALLAVPFIDARERAPFDPQSWWPSDVAVHDTVTPLALVKSQLVTQSPQLLFTVHLAGTAPTGQVDRVSVARLDDFDGEVWTSTPKLRTAGMVLRTVPGGNASQVIARFDVRQLPLPLLPVVGWPETLQLVPSAGQDTMDGTNGRIAFDQASGTVATFNSPSVRRYEEIGDLHVPSPAFGQLTRAQEDQYTRLPPGVAAEMRRLATGLVPGAGADAGTLRAMETRLRDLPYSAQAPAGHSVAAIRRILTESEPANAGYSEQHAAAFAALTRSLGLPSRVVIGYLLQTRTSPDVYDYNVTPKDAHAWVEVFLDGRWETFDPTDVQKPPVPYPAATPISAEQIVPPETVDPPPPAPVAPTTIADPPAAGGGEGIRWRVIGAVLATLVGALLLATLLRYLILEPVRRRNRRRRRRLQGPPAIRVIGAWEEALDALSHRKFSAPVSSTTSQITSAAQERFGHGARALVSLARLTNAALFDPAPPTEDDAQKAWSLEARLRTELRTEPKRTVDQLASTSTHDEATP